MARRCITAGGMTAAAFAALLAAPLPRTPGEEPPAPAPIRFQDLSGISDGPVLFGKPKSTLEKSSCAFFDADGDGWDDLVVLTGLGEPFRYFLNRADGAGGRTFVPAPQGNGLDDGVCRERDGAAVVAADVDLDGDQDLFVGFSWNSAFATGQGRNALLLNDGTGRFADFAPQAGLLDGDNTTCGACFFDIDLDGDLDLFTCNTDFSEAAKEGDGRAHLWRNEMKETGKLHFREETEDRGIVEIGTAVWCVTGVDQDGDGDFDLQIGHDIAGPTQLFRNDGTGHFEEVTDSAGSGAGDDGNPSTFGNDSKNAMGFAWGDYDNDGDADLYVANIAKNPLYRNNGDGTFTELGETAGVRASGVLWGVNFADFDLDGHLDLYVAGGDIWNYARLSVKTFLFRNRGDGTFADVTATANLRRDVPLHREGGTAVSDFDRDGRTDLLVARCERDGASPYLYHNVTETAGRRWLELSLRGNGRTTNRDAIGAKIRVVPRDSAGGVIPGIAQFREINGGDSRGARSSLVQVFGLGTDAVSADVTVVWPRAGTLGDRTQVWLDVPLDRFVVLSEDLREAGWRLLPDRDAIVPGGQVTELDCPGTGTPDPLTRLTVESGPPWATMGARGEDGVRRVVLAPPTVTEPVEAEVTLLAVAQGASEPESRQTLRLSVLPAPRISWAYRSHRVITLRGARLARPGLVVTVDGVEVVPFEARPRVLRIRLPRETLRAWGRKKAHRVEVRDPLTGGIAWVRLFG